MQFLITLIAALSIVFAQSSEQNNVLTDNDIDAILGIPKEIVYKVKSGDSLWKIAEEANSSPDDILEQVRKIKELNESLNSKGDIYPDQELVIAIDNAVENYFLDYQFKNSTNNITRSSNNTGRFLFNTSNTVISIEDVQHSVVVVFAQNLLRNINKKSTGVVIDEKGTVLTTQHSLRNATKIYIKYFKEGDSEKPVSKWRKEVVPAKVVKFSSEKDLALIIPKETLNFQYVPIKFANNFSIGKSDKAASLGHPGGYYYTYSEGVINNIKNNYDEHPSLPEFSADVIFASAGSGTAEGASGSPLLNKKNHMIGLISSKSETMSQMYLSIKINEIKEFIEQ